MTTVITRVFKDEATAQQAVAKLRGLGIPHRACEVISKGSGETKAALEAAQVHESAIADYAKHINAGHAIAVARTTYKPLSAARLTRETFASFETMDDGAVMDDFFMPDGPETASSILKSHPRFLTVAPSSTDYQGGPVTSGWGMRMLSARKNRTSAISGGRFFSRTFWPMPLLSRKNRKKSVISGGRYMSRGFWPMDLLVKKPRNNSVIKGGSLPLSEAVGIPPVV